MIIEIDGKLWQSTPCQQQQGGGKSDAPDTPDYAAAAQATAQGNSDAARIAAKANRVSQYTPYGNLIYTQGNGAPVFNQSAYDAATKAYQSSLSSYNSGASPSNSHINPAVLNGNGGLGGYNNTPARGVAPIAPNINDYYTTGDQDTWTATQTLSPDEQKKLDLNNNLAIGSLETAQKGLKSVDDALSNPFDFSRLPAQQVNAGQTAQDAIMSRLNPQFAQSEESLRTRLVNQGVRPGTQAWDNEFRNFNSGKNDAYSQAALQGISVGQQARQQALQEQEFGRTEGLNIVNALRTGNQVQAPNFITTPNQATTAGPDLLGATQAGYQGDLGATNAKNASSAGFLGGVGNIAQAGVSAYFL